MKKIYVIAAFVIALFLFSSCSANQEGNIRYSEAVEYINEELETSLLYSSYDASEYIGMDYNQVEALFRDAGFTHVILIPVDDIDSNSNVPDGSVESVSINEIYDYTTSTGFDLNSEVVVTYHNIPKIAVPISQDDAISMHYMDVGRAFFNAGFVDIETDEKYDLPVGASSKTVIYVNDIELSDASELPFDSHVSIIEHNPISEYSVTINIDFVSNWIFSKYDVVVTLGDNTLGTLPHGEDGEFQLNLPAGNYDLVFSKEDNSDVCGNISLVIDSDTAVDYRISCNHSTVSIEEKKYVHVTGSNYLLMPYSSSHYLRKDYKAVVEELEAQGFTHITTKESVDTVWIPDMVDSVVRVEIGGRTDFKHDEVFEKKSLVIVYYHVSDFEFNQNSVSVTEKDTFNLDYSMTSGDTIDSIIFVIDNPDVLQHNEDGSFTALTPGIATVTASSGGHSYSECVVEVSEIVVPIEKIEFSSDEMEIPTGSSFTIDYTIVPENANYTDMRIEISNDLVEQKSEGLFYSVESGDSEIVFFQDDRILGSCTIHSSLIEIEDLILEKSTVEVFAGEVADLSFALKPENATNKGISVSSSNPDIAEANFDEFGPSLIRLNGKGIGQTEVIITTPGGVNYSFTVIVKEVEPVEIILTNANPRQRIEVGTPCTLDVSWNPENTTIKELEWSSSNNEVIQIDEEGNLIAVGVGTAEITAIHKSGVSATLLITVEPTLVTKIEVTSSLDDLLKMHVGDKHSLITEVFPENATDKTLSFSTSDESVALVTNTGEITAVGIGSTTITITSQDGPKQSISVTVLPLPQKFQITWSTYLVSNDHVGSNWYYYFSVNEEEFYSGNSIVLDPNSSISIYFYVEDVDDNPDTGVYIETIDYSDELCKNGYSIATTVSVRENGGRYANHYATWNLNITISPIS